MATVESVERLFLTNTTPSVTIINYVTFWLAKKIKRKLKNKMNNHKNKK